MKIGVVGSGLMARGILRLLTSKNQDATLINPRFSAGFDLQAFSNLDLIIECVVENFETKVEVIRKIRSMNPNAIIGTSTSSLGITQIQQHLNFDSKFLGIHFMNPPSQIRSVELVKGHSTQLEIVDFVSQWITDLGQLAVLVEDKPGFVVNALLFAMLNRAALLLEESEMSAVELDNLICLSLGHKIGPYRTMDLIGIDTCKVILENLYLQDSAKNFKPANIFDQLVENGKLGRKTKSGFLDYN
jgi:3-hydroxybutyryl-CoA dehydrogenase